MAVLPQALQFSETPIKVLLDIAEQNRQQQLLMEKARLEDLKARGALPMELVNAMDNLDSDVQNQYAGSFLNNVTTAVRNKNIPTASITDYIARGVMDIKSKSAAIKQWKDGFKEATTGLGSDSGIYTDQLKAAGSKYLLESLKDPKKLQELKNPNDWIYEAINNAPELFANRESGASVFNEILAKTPKADMTEIIKVDNTGNMSLTEKSGGKIPWWYTMKEGVGPTGLKIFTPELKTDAAGNISEDVFNSFYTYKDPKNQNDFRMRFWIDGGANDLITKNNIGKNPGDADYMDPNDDGSKAIAKRSFLKEQLELRPSYDAPRESAKDRPRPNVTNVYTGVPTGSQANPFEDLEANAKSNKPLNKMPKMHQEYILDAANTIKPKPGGLKHTNANTEIKYENGEVNLYNKATGDLIFTVDQTGFNTGVLGQLGPKAGQAGYNYNNNPPAGKKVWDAKTGKYIIQ
jgi:hypothetical protein